MSTLTHRCLSLKIVFLERLLFPVSSSKHFGSKLRLKDLLFSSKVFSFRHLISLCAFNCHVLTFFVVIYLLLIMRIRITIVNELLQLLLVKINWISCNPFKLIAVFLDPFLLHGFTKADLRNLRPNATFHFSYIYFLSRFHFGYELELW